MRVNKYTEKDIYYAKRSLALAEKSYKQGNFPAGALIVQNEKIISESISGSYPKINIHAESQAIDLAINKINAQLEDCILYTSMETCLMCLSRAYWAGLRKIVYVIRKKIVSSKLCYESDLDHNKLLAHFHKAIEVLNILSLEKDALKVVRSWERNQRK